jgi:hypothetical protein
VICVSNRLPPSAQLLRRGCHPTPAPPPVEIPRVVQTDCTHIITITVVIVVVVVVIIFDAAGGRTSAGSMVSPRSLSSDRSSLALMKPLPLHASATRHGTAAAESVPASYLWSRRRVLLRGARLTDRKSRRLA